MLFLCANEARPKRVKGHGNYQAWRVAALRSLARLAFRPFAQRENGNDLGT